MANDTVEEGGQIGYQIDFLDDDGNAVTPNAGTLAWSLVDDNGETVNARSEVAIASASTVFVSTTGDDNLVEGVKNLRSLRVAGKYNSVNFGNDQDIVVVRLYEIINYKGAIA